eukprot:177475_1
MNHLKQKYKNDNDKCDEAREEYQKKLEDFSSGEIKNFKSKKIKRSHRRTVSKIDLQIEMNEAREEYQKKLEDFSSGEIKNFKSKKIKRSHRRTVSKIDLQIEMNEAREEYQ